MSTLSSVTVKSVLLSFPFFFLPPKHFRGRVEGTSTEEDLLMREIEDLPVVTSLSFIHTIGRDKSGYHTNLRCPVVSSHGDCTDAGCTVKQVGTIRMSTKHPTMFDCLCEFLTRIQQNHDRDCVTSVQTCQAPSSDVESTKRPVVDRSSSCNANDVLLLRAQLKSLEERSVITNKSVLKTEKEGHKLQKELHLIEVKVQGKRACTHDDTGNGRLSVVCRSNSS
jgi:hypothetical protein